MDKFGGRKRGTRQGKVSVHNSFRDPHLTLSTLAFQKAETILDIKKSVTTYGSGRPTEVRDVHIIDGGRLCHDDERLDALEQPANLEIIYRYT